ncbi:MarR family winged helix-turn-helix transcriptional regulator [Variovorax ureilyticus]|uniref:MarR family winged helix-turn-helix transcriptional regulator n=1 Tax=Variovorax ureilyticus TaxID=1836198 RepID=A0ABU8VAS9_9BURK
MPATKASTKADRPASKLSRRAIGARAEPNRKTKNPPPVQDLNEDAVLIGSDGIDLENYLPAYLTWVANKLSRSASQHYLRLFDIGIETWRCMVLLAVEDSISAQKVSQIIGMDKGSVSRCFKSMQAKGLIKLGLEASDGRLRIATLTAKGRALHEQIRGIALERERALLSVLSDSEREVLLSLLKRLHENLPQVELATQRYVDGRFPFAQALQSRSSEQHDDEQ